MQAKKVDDFEEDDILPFGIKLKVSEKSIWKVGKLLRSQLKNWKKTLILYKSNLYSVSHQLHDLLSV